MEHGNVQGVQVFGGCLHSKTQNRSSIMKSFKISSRHIAALLLCCASATSAISITIVEDRDWQFLATYHSTFTAGTYITDSATITSTYWSGQVGFGAYPYPWYSPWLDFIPTLEMGHSSAGSGGGSHPHIDTEHMFFPTAADTWAFTLDRHSSNPYFSTDHFIFSGIFNYDPSSRMGTVDGSINITRNGIPRTPDSGSTAFLTMLALGMLLCATTIHRKWSAR